MKYTAIVDGQPLELEFERQGTHGIEARIAGRVYVLEASAVQEGVYWFNWNHRSIQVTVTPGADGYVAAVNGHHVSVEILDSRTALKKAAQHAHDGVAEIRAPMPGKIAKVLVAEGDSVTAGQGLVVMEAMKMQNELKSPKAGVVKKLAVGEGVAVNAGELLALVE